MEPLFHLQHAPFAVRKWTSHVGRTWARLSYGYHVEPTWLAINQIEIPIVGLPASFDGFRIVQLSDLHCSRQVPMAHVHEAIERANAERADLAVVTGDFIHQGFDHIDAAADAVQRLVAPHGTFAVLGNHDFSVRNALGIRRYPDLHQRVADALDGRRVRVLRNESTSIQVSGESIYLSGVDDLWSRACDLPQTFASVPSDAVRILLAHNPRTVEVLGEHHCDLILSGHTHGGQINWPGLGRFFLGRRVRRFASGLYRHGPTHLYVHNGIGYSVRFRFRVRPEVAVFTLRRRET